MIKWLVVCPCIIGFQVLSDLHNSDTRVLYGNHLQSCDGQGVTGPALENNNVQTEVGQTHKVRSDIDSTEKSSIIGHESNQLLCDMGSDSTGSNSLVVIDNNSDALLGDAHNGTVAVQEHDRQTADSGFEPRYANTATPMSIWNNRFQCVDFIQYVAQNESDFGALPITAQVTYQGPVIDNAPITDIIDLHYKIVGRQFTVHNPSELYVLVSSALPTTRRDMTCTVLKAT